MVAGLKETPWSYVKKTCLIDHCLLSSVSMLGIESLNLLILTAERKSECFFQIRLYFFHHFPCEDWKVHYKAKKIIIKLNVNVKQSLFVVQSLNP